MDFKSFGVQQPPRAFGSYCQKRFLSASVFWSLKHAEFWMRALNGLCKELAIQALNVFVQNPTTYSAEKGFSVLVDIKTKKRSCLLNETLDDLMRGGGGDLEQEVEPN